MFISCDWQS